MYEASLFDWAIPFNPVSPCQFSSIENKKYLLLCTNDLVSIRIDETKEMNN